MMTKELFPSHQFQWGIIRQISNGFWILITQYGHKFQSICSYLGCGEGQGSFCKQPTPLLISMSILRDLPQQKKNPRVICPGISPQVICSHVPMEMLLFYEMGKKPGNKKESLFFR
jgi:hypothetical protein